MATATAAAQVAKKSPTTEIVQIRPPKFRTVQFTINGTAPYLQASFSGKVAQAMIAKMREGKAGGSKKVREARDFDNDVKEATHFSTEGWIGIPASAFRNACIDVCRLVGFKMTLARMSIFFEGDGLDRISGMPLIKLIAGDPEKTTLAVRNATGVIDIRARPMWRSWKAKLRMRFDEDQFTLSDVTNLLARAGQQVGIGEGRPFSRESNGLGFGLFEVLSDEQS